MTAAAAAAAAASRPAARDKLRGTPSSPSSMLHFSGLRSGGALLQCLREAVCPTVAVPPPAARAAAPAPAATSAAAGAAVSAGAAAGAGAGAARRAVIPLSLLATPSAGANAQLRTIAGRAAAERHVDVPQILSCAPFLHASLRRLVISTRRRARVLPAAAVPAALAAGDDGDAVAAFGSIELDVAGGPLLPGVAERIARVITDAAGADAAGDDGGSGGGGGEAAVISDPHLATAADYGAPDEEQVPAELARILSSLAIRTRC